MADANWVPDEGHASILKLTLQYMCVRGGPCTWGRLAGWLAGWLAGCVWGCLFTVREAHTLHHG
jgi:hypothetical protein